MRTENNVKSKTQQAVAPNNVKMKIVREKDKLVFTKSVKQVKHKRNKGAIWTVES